TRDKAGAHADRLTTLVVDIADETSVREGVRAATDALGGLDVLVNAAGILRSSHTEETALADFTRVLTVNLVGTFLVIREAIPALLEGKDAAVVNFSSTSAAF
ncbi:SDR family oxidoreductase, partial [Streptomyces sp. SID6648]|nr:SDR family oxidoreductase [Streptomyces sp. SID6648]